jgi:hypothetical protein
MLRLRFSEEPAMTSSGQQFAQALAMPVMVLVWAGPEAAMVTPQVRVK